MMSGKTLPHKGVCMYVMLRKQEAGKQSQHTFDKDDDLSDRFMVEGLGIDPGGLELP
jgi:hypothetical protein